MTHPIIALQAALVAALRAELDVPVFDTPLRDATPPYIAIARHDVLPRDGDVAPGHEHRLLLHVWAAEASRKAVLAIAEAVVEIDEVAAIIRCRGCTHTLATVLHTAAGTRIVFGTLRELQVPAGDAGAAEGGSVSPAGA